MPQPLHPYRMAWSFKVGRLFGIDVKVHLIFLVIIAWLSLDVLFETGSLKSSAWVFCQLVIVFTIVLMHELGHSLMAQRHGIRVIDITLWPLGGLARLDGKTEDPKTELKIAVAGPAVNLALAALVFPIWYGMEPFSFASLLLTPTGFLIWINLLMGLFNLIPAFPMDGGRILRAIMASKLPFLKATEIAVFIGKLLAWAGIIFAVYRGDFWICVICLFILWAGSSELRAARAREYMQNAWRQGFGQGGFGRDIFGKNPFGRGDFDPQGQRDDIIDAEVVSGETKSVAPDPDTPADREPLSDTERQFIDFIKKYGRKPDGK